MTENLVENQDQDLSHYERTRKLMLKTGTGMQKYVLKNLNV